MPEVNEELGRQLAGRAYNNAVIVSPEDLTDVECQSLPPWWINAVAHDAAEAMEAAVSQWRSALPGKFPRFLEVLLERAAGLHLARLGLSKDRTVLVYALHSAASDDEIDPFVCWYGRPPSEQLVNGRIDIDRLPESVRTIYTGLHDDLGLAGFNVTGFALSSEMSPSISVPMGSNMRPRVIINPRRPIWCRCCRRMGTSVWS